MSQTITVKATIPVTIPDDKIVVDRVEFERLQGLADTSRWWTSAEVSERYHVSQTWLRKNVIDAPRFERALQDIVHNFGGKNGYLYEPTGFAKFMRQWFGDIAREVSK